MVTSFSDQQQRKGSRLPRRPAPASAVAKMLGALLALALLLRLAVLASPIAAPNGDEGVTGLMAEDIGQGRSFTFFAGQSYMGALEQYLQALFVLVRPADPFALRLTSVLLSTAAVWLVFAIGQRMFASDRAALVAAAGYAVAPAFNLLDGVRSMGAYNSALVVGLLGLYLALAPGPPSPRRFAAVGCCCGLGLWLTAVSGFLLLPAAIWMFSGLRALTARRAPMVAFAVGAAVGALPIVMWMISNGSLPLLASASRDSAPHERFAGLLTSALPQALGLAWKGATSPVPTPVLTMAAAAVLVGWLVAAWRHRQLIGSLLSPRYDDRDPRAVLLIAPVIVITLYVASPYTWWSAEPRYLFTAMPWLALALGWLLRDRPVPSVAIVAALGVCSVLTLTLASIAAPSTWIADLRSTADWMRARGIDASYADYRVAHTMDFVSAGPTPVVVPLAGFACRFPARTAQVDAADRVAYVASAGDWDRVEQALAAYGFPVAARQVTATVRAYELPAPGPRPWELGLVSTPPPCSS